MSAMKKLTFGKGLLAPTLTGGKKITLRKYRVGRHDFTKGDIILGEFRDGFSILLHITADTQTKLFSNLTDREAQEDGFESARDAMDGLTQIGRAHV